MTTVGFIPPAVPIGIKALTWAIGVGGAVLSGFNVMKQGTDAANTAKAESPTLAVDNKPSVPVQEPSPEQVFAENSPLTEEKPAPPLIGPLTPVSKTVETVAQVPKPVTDPQAPITQAFVPAAPTPVPPAPPGGGVVGGLAIPDIWGLAPGDKTKVRFGIYSSPQVGGFGWNEVVYSYRWIVGSDPVAFQPIVTLKLNGTAVWSWEPQTFTTVPPVRSSFVTFVGFTDPDGHFVEENLDAMVAKGYGSFIKASPYVPLPEPQPELEPEPEPLPLPATTPFTPIPNSPPDTRPLPTPEPDTDIAPAAVPAVWPPVVVPLPPASPVPTPSAPLDPNAPVPVPPVDQDGKPATVPPVVVTNKDQHTIGNNTPVVSTGPAPTLEGIAKEVGRIEQKIATMYQPGGANTPDWGDLFPLLNFLSGLFQETAPDAVYRLQSVCERNSQGQPIDQAVEVQIPALDLLHASIARLDAIEELLQGLKDFKQPICSTHIEPVTGTPVTINWISKGYSPVSGDRLRKLFTYFDDSGATLEQTTDHWKDFEWSAGPVIVSCKGTPLGKPQVWASSTEEAKRVIGHAALIAGVDLTNAEWLVSTSRDSRYGVSAEMMIRRGKDGTFGITKRSGPSGPPPALAPSSAPGSR